MAHGSNLGAGLFLGAGQALAVGGPASLLISYVSLSAFVYCLVTAMAEFGAYMPFRGVTMGQHAARYVSPTLGFSLDFLHWYSLAMLVPYQLTAASLLMGGMNPGLHPAIPMTTMFTVMVLLNSLPEQTFRRAETNLTRVKIGALTGMVILSLVLFCGGGPNGGFLGFRYWNDPGAFAEFLEPGAAGRFFGFLQCLMNSVVIFNFAPELVVIRGSEMVSPRRSVPQEAQNNSGLLSFLYIMSSLAMGVMSPSNDPRLLNGDSQSGSGSSGSGSSGSGTSPFVIGIRNAGIRFLDTIVNALIMASSSSSGSSFLHRSSLSLQSLAESGSAPRFLRVRNRWGLPYMAVALSALFGPLAYLSVVVNGPTLFNWLMNFTNTSGYISWICSCIVYFRFRRALRVQGVEPPYRSRIQPYGAYVGIAGSTLLCLLNGFSVFFPWNWSVSELLAAYTGIPVFLLLYSVHRIRHWRDPWAWRSEDVDLHTGLEEILAAEKPPEVREWWWKRLWQGLKRLVLAVSVRTPRVGKPLRHPSNDGDPRAVEE
ncbi:hypothetical protein VTN02DRAFT_4899 [Thermoascus thermophilus]